MVIIGHRRSEDAPWMVAAWIGAAQIAGAVAALLAARALFTKSEQQPEAAIPLDR